MKNQYGQSMTEFLVVMPVMLLLIFGAIQFVLIYQTKTTLNYATFEAARAGSLGNASRTAMNNGFTRGLAPLFARFSTTRKEAGDDGYDILADNVLSARDIAIKELKFVKIELINPKNSDFNAFDDKIIPNDNLSFRHTARDNGINLRDANLLKIRVTYCMKLIVPIVSNLITGVSVFSNAPGISKNPVTEDELKKIADECPASDEKRFPIVAHAVIRMQSPAIFCSGCFDDFGK